MRRSEDLDRIDGLVLPGGESTTMSLLLGSSGLVEPLADRLSDGLPAFGTCAGMILLATEVVDGRVDQYSFGVIDISVKRNAFGRQLQSFETTLAVRHIDGAPVPAVFIRAPAVVRTGPQVEILARVEVPGCGDETGPVVVCRQGAV
ncbi:MAG: pyridoxal 5'-phosphate synthase glutaminase subunit PdxT, partial [Actinomycetota bacterium]|nr:pyridoxal 5'-phosphate synthase glutaminase subunit PdxT [Actinomycetota bacterium]